MNPNTKINPMNQIKPITFTSDQYRLHGILHLPDRQNPPIVIGCHGLLANCDSPKQITLANHLSKIGIAYLRFDHRGCGKSQGDFIKVTTLSARCTDLKCAMAAVKKIVPSEYPIGLFGSSMGGAVCLAVASEMATGPKAIVAAPINTKNIHRVPQQQGPDGRQLPESFYTHNLIFDLQDQIDRVSNILIFHGDMDEVVPVENAYNLHTRVNDPKKLIIQEKGDHGMSNPLHQKKFLSETIRWFQIGMEKISSETSE